jgi:hypothetical protein
MAVKRKPRRVAEPKKPPIKATEPHVKALFRFMDLHRISFRVASEKSGVDQRVISGWRTGNSTPRLDLFVAVCEAVGLILSIAIHSKRAHNIDADQFTLEL